MDDNNGYYDATIRPLQPSGVPLGLPYVVDSGSTFDGLGSTPSEVEGSKASATPFMQ